MSLLASRAQTIALALSPVGRSSWQNFTNAVALYFILTRTLKAGRHLRARGIVQTARDFYKWVIQVRTTRSYRFLACQHVCIGSNSTRSPLPLG